MLCDSLVYSQTQVYVPYNPASLTILQHGKLLVWASVYLTSFHEDKGPVR